MKLRKLIGLAMEKAESAFSTECGRRNVFNRDKWVAERLSVLKPGSSILDVGAGECKYKKYCSHLIYKSQDFCEYKGDIQRDGPFLKWNISNIDIVSDITKIPEQDESFDAILCTEVFEHLLFPEQALKELWRLLKKGGTLIFTAPFCSLTHQRPYYFYNGFSRYYYEKMFPASGFAIKEISYNGNYFEYLAQELRRVRQMADKYSRINGWDKILFFIFNICLLRIFYKFSHFDKGSCEMLVFGIHIVAFKK